ncbi:MAG: PAS domain S-box protein, partial [Bacteroidetes bacterium]|nr:PAS domain S-box protein [Bacteroidota bacterium]
MKYRKSTSPLLTGLIIFLSVMGVLWAFHSPAADKDWILLSDILFLAASLLILYFTNFTRGRASEERRSELEASLRLVVRNIKDYAIFLVDPEGRVMSWNQGAQQIKGYTEDETIGKPISLFYTDEEARNGEPFNNLQRAAEEGRYESIGLRKRKDGSLFYADVVFTPLYDDRNNLKGFIKITRDISDRKKAESDILGSLQREKELNDLKSRFVSIASHEFKTPLSVILSSTNLIEKYPETGMQPQRLKHTHRIRSNVNNLKQILNDFLSLEKLEAGVTNNTPIPTDLLPFLEETIHDLEEARKEGQHITIQTEGPLHPIPVDPYLLRNVLTNLLSNAIKYSPEQSPICCAVHFHHETVSISIKDCGMGIPAEDQPHLFERFFRASNTTGISGTGLGLSIVRRYLDLMGGSIAL